MVTGLSLAFAKQSNDQLPIWALQRYEQQYSSSGEGPWRWPGKVQNILKDELLSELSLRQEYNFYKKN